MDFFPITTMSAVYKDGTNKTVNEIINNIVQYNISDYEGNSLDVKWSNMKKQFLPWQYKKILIPFPKDNEEGAIFHGGKWKWFIKNSILFDDSCNCSQIQIDGEIISKGNIESALKFEDANKPENIIFSNGLIIRNGDDKANDLLNVGIDIRGGERIMFLGETIINDCNIGVVIGGDHQSSPSSVNFNQLSIGFPKSCGILGYGNTHDINLIANEIYVQIFQEDKKDAMILKGLVGKVNINLLQYNTDIPKNGFKAFKCNSVIKILSLDDKFPNDIFINTIYGFNSDYGIIIDNEGTNENNRSNNIIVNSIRNSNESNTPVAYKINYCNNVNIGSIGKYCSGEVGEKTEFTRFTFPTSLKPIDDKSSKHIIGNLVRTNLGVYTLPDTNKYPLGTIIANSTENSKRIYIKCDDTGNTDNDIIGIDNQMFIPRVNSLPIATWELRGKLFMLWNDDTEDEIYICIRKNKGYKWLNLKGRDILPDEIFEIEE